MKKNGKVILILSGGALVIAAAAGLAYHYWPASAPDPKTQSPEEITNYLASKNFAGLPKDKKQAYWRATTQRSGDSRRAIFSNRGKLSEQQRRQLFENVRPMIMKMMIKRVDKYFSLPPEKRTAYLDEMIDRMQDRRASRPPRRSESSGSAGAKSDGKDSPRRGRHRFTPARLKKILEKTPPEQRAKFMEFHKAIRKRMEERGIAPPWRK